jgi:hypothetical protein
MMTVIPARQITTAGEGARNATNKTVETVVGDGADLPSESGRSYNTWMSDASPQQPADAAGQAEIPPDWLRDFEAAAGRTLEERFRYAFIHTYKPVLDDASFRAFDTTADYRRWCEENLSDWLGYGRV